MQSTVHPRRASHARTRSAAGTRVSSVAMAADAGREQLLPVLATLGALLLSLLLLLGPTGPGVS